MDHHQLNKHHKLEGKSHWARILVGIGQSYKEIVFEEEPKVFLSISFITKLTVHISTNRKKTHWISRGHETQFNSKFGVKLSLHVLSFLECFQPIISAIMCIIAINVF
jgi:hypothetical protein